MNRQDYVRICKQCQNSKMDFKLGIVCGLTGKHADFIGTCEHFIPDEVEVQKEFERKEEERQLLEEIRAYKQKSKKIDKTVFTAKIVVYIIIGIIALIALANS